MMAALLPLLLTCGAVLFSVHAQDNYSRLPDSFRKGVDLTLQKFNSHAGVQHHFLFFRSLLQSDIQPGFDVTYIYHHFYLKATQCPKGTVDSQGCQFRNDRPVVDCAVCYKTFQGEIEPEPKPYINCMHKPSLTAAMTAARVRHCNSMGYSSGAPTLLATKGIE